MLTMYNESGRPTEEFLQLLEEMGEVHYADTADEVFGKFSMGWIILENNNTFLNMLGCFLSDYMRDHYKLINMGKLLSCVLFNLRQWANIEDYKNGTLTIEDFSRFKQELICTFHEWGIYDGAEPKPENYEQFTSYLYNYLYINPNICDQVREDIYDGYIDDLNGNLEEPLDPYDMYEEDWNPEAIQEATKWELITKYLFGYAYHNILLTEPREEESDEEIEEGDELDERFFEETGIFYSPPEPNDGTNEINEEKAEKIKIEPKECEICSDENDEFIKCLKCKNLLCASCYNKLTDVYFKCPHCREPF